MFGLVAACLLLVSAAVWFGSPVVSSPPTSPVIKERYLYLSGDMSGAARVLDANGVLVSDLSAEEGGFIAGIVRVLERERAKIGAAPDGPVRVVQTENRRVAIFDPSTGWTADLMGFGADNSAAFAKLLN
jgi:putative photosynthetic complex assembly protein